MRGKGWGRKHSTVDYVFKHNFEMLWYYHLLVMEEMKKRKYRINIKWLDIKYRGKQIGYVDMYSLPVVWTEWNAHNLYHGLENYPEHNNEYLKECLENLKGKGIEICLKI